MGIFRGALQYYGVDGALCLCESGYAGVRYKYNERGEKIMATFNGINGKPCMCIQQYCSHTAEYDERGNLVKMFFWDTEGKPCLTADGCASALVKWDERGNKIGIDYFGVDGKPCEIKEGYAKYVKEFDEHNFPVKTIYTDLNGVVLKMKIEGFIVIINEVGKAADSGLSGVYYVLEYCGWKLGDSIIDFENQVILNRNKKKSVLLLDGKGKIYSRNFGEELMDVLFQSHGFSKETYLRLQNSYEQFKREQGTNDYNKQDLAPVSSEKNKS